MVRFKHDFGQSSISYGDPIFGGIGPPPTDDRIIYNPELLTMCYWHFQAWTPAQHVLFILLHILLSEGGQIKSMRKRDLDCSGISVVKIVPPNESL